MFPKDKGREGNEGFNSLLTKIRKRLTPRSTEGRAEKGMAMVSRKSVGASREKTDGRTV